MAKEKKIKRMDITEKKSILTTFLLLFPSMIIALIATVNQSNLLSGITIALFFYQAILLKNFVSEHYSLA